MKTRLVILSLFFGVVTLFAQSTTPNCSIRNVFTNSGANQIYDNRHTQCTGWQLTFSASGYSNVGIELDTAPDNNGVPGTWTQQLLLSNANSATGSWIGYGPWIRILLSTAVGSGPVTFTTSGYVNNPNIASTVGARLATTDPTGNACTNPAVAYVYLGNVYTCQGSTYVELSTGGGGSSPLIAATNPKGNACGTTGIALIYAGSMYSCVAGTYQFYANVALQASAPTGTSCTGLTNPPVIQDLSGNLFTCQGTTYQKYGPNFVSLTSCPGVDPTGAANSATAITNCIAAQSPGTTITVPPGSYLLANTTGTEEILIAQNVNLQCAGWGNTQFIVASTVPNTIDIIHVKPGTAGIVGSFIRDCQITTQSTNAGRYGINLDGTGSLTYQNIVNFQLAHNWVPLTGGNFALYMPNSTSGGGTYDSQILYNTFSAGISTSNLGDAVSFVGNQLQGPGPGIYLDNLTGSTGLTVAHNSITNCSGGIVINRGNNPLIDHNEIEAASTCASFPETNHAAIDVIGTTPNPVLHPMITHNTINPLDGTTVNLIRLDRINGGNISDNECSTLTSSMICVVRTANNTGLYIGPQYNGGAPASQLLGGTPGTSENQNTQIAVTEPALGFTVSAVNTSHLGNPGTGYPPTVAPTCVSSCSTTYTYAYSYADALGNETLITTGAGQTSVLNNATLNGSNYNTITPIGALNIPVVNVYRVTPNPGYIGSVQVSTNTFGILTPLVDNGIAAGRAAPTVNTTGAFDSLIIPLSNGMWLNGFLGIGPQCTTPSVDICITSTSTQENGSGGYPPILGFDHTGAANYAAVVNAASEYNTWFGVGAGYGASSSSSASVGFGYNAGNGNSAGQYNTYVGFTAGQTSSGNYNTFIGSTVGSNNGTGYANTAVGQSAMSAASGYNNTCIGASCEVNNTGNDNVAVGLDALIFNTSGIENVAIGDSAAGYTTNGSTHVTQISDSIFIGINSEPANATGDSYEICIADTCKGQGSNTTTIGNSNTTSTYLAGNYLPLFSGSLLGNATNPFKNLYLYGTGTYGTGYSLITPGAVSTNQYTITLPLATTTLAGLSFAQSWTAPQTFSSGDAIFTSSSSYGAFKIVPGAAYTGSTDGSYGRNNTTTPAMDQIYNATYAQNTIVNETSSIIATAQNAAISATTISTPSSATSQIYRIEGQIIETTPGTGCSGSYTMTITWYDLSGAAQSYNLLTFAWASSLTASSGTAPGTRAWGSMLIDQASTTTLPKYAITIPSGCSSMQYAYSIHTTRLL